MASQWALFREDAAFALANVGVGTTLGLIGIIVGYDREQRGTGWLFALTGILWLVSWCTEWPVGPVPVVSLVLGQTSLAFGAWVVLRYPGSRLARPAERWYVLTLFSWLTAGELLLVLVSRPEWTDIAGSVWWPRITENHHLFHLIGQVYSVGILVFAVAFMILLGQRLSAARGVARSEQVPLAVVAGATATLTISEMTAGFYDLPQNEMFVVWMVEGIAMLAAPIAFAVVALQQRLARLAVADLVLSVGGTATPESVLHALRQALRDPDLEILYWMPQSGTHVSATGQIAETLPTGDDRLVVPIATRSGEPLAVVVTTPLLRRRRDVVAAAAAAVGMALENGRLHAELRAQLHQVAQSRTRIVEAGLAERRRLERDLHDGAQQRLLGVAMMLSSARLRATEQGTVDTIDLAGAEVRAALAELRDLARGIHPAVLTQYGLEAALEGVAERLPMPVTVSVPRTRLLPNVEATAYFVATEALTNAVRHAHAGQARVEVRLENEEVLVDVTDDGRGGAAVRPGGGLAGLADRVRALGGDIAISSSPADGTRLSARIPCG